MDEPKELTEDQTKPPFKSVSTEDNADSSVGSSESKFGGLRFGAPILALVLAADQLTKNWAVSNLSNESCEASTTACIDLFWTLRFKLVYNTGVAFTTGSSLGVLWGLIAAIVSGVLIYMSWKRPDKFGAFMLGLIAGGALGNLTDRLFRGESGFLSGAVVDFIDLQWWPVFNIADAAIVIGVVGLLVASVFGDTDLGSDQKS